MHLSVRDDVHSRLYQFVLTLLGPYAAKNGVLANMAQSQKVRGGNTTVAFESDSIIVTFYGTVVASVRRDTEGSSYVKLNNGGFSTSTTKLRMNQFANEYCSGAFSVYQRKGDWFVAIEGVERHFVFEHGKTAFYIPSDKVRYSK